MGYTEGHSPAAREQIDHGDFVVALFVGRTYYRKKIAEGKTHREAMRCLKRRVSDAVFKRLTADLEEVLIVV